MKVCVLVINFCIYCPDKLKHHCHWRCPSLEVKSQLLLCQSRLTKICMDTKLTLPEMRQMSYNSHLQERPFFSPDNTLHEWHIHAHFGFHGKSFHTLKWVMCLTNPNQWLVSIIHIFKQRKPQYWSLYWPGWSNQ